MTSPSRVDHLCRLTVLTGSSSADVALPVHIPLVEILPSLVDRLGDPRISAAGVVVQRWGEEPLDERRTPADLGLLDGETLHLRPRQENTPPAEFDDLVDAISSTTGQPAQRWHSNDTVTLMRLGAVVPLMLVAASLVLLGPSVARQIAAAAAALVAAALAVAAEKGFGDRAAALVLTLAALGSAAVCGVLVAAGTAVTDLPPLAWIVTPAAAAAGGAAVLVLAVGLLPVLDDRLPLLVPSAFVGLLVSGFGLLSAFTPMGPAAAAALVLVLSLVCTTAAPRLAFRLARRQIPAPPPGGVEDLEFGGDPLPGRAVVEQIRLADRCTTGLLYGLSATTVVVGTVLVGMPGWAAVVLVALAALLQLVRIRLLRGAVQRIALLVSGVHLAVVALLRLLALLPPAVTVAVSVAVLLVAALLLLGSARWLADRMVLPHWTRACEIVEWLTWAALLPVAALLLGVYGWARELAG